MGSVPSAHYPGPLRMPRLNLRPPRLRRFARPPLALIAIVIVAFASALAWGIVQPPFQGPDEIEHIAYVQRLAETGSPPRMGTDGPPWSSEIQTALVTLSLGPIKGHLDARPSFAKSDHELWEAYERDIAPGQRENGSGRNGQARTPPLYYLINVPVYLLAPSDLLDRIAAMRVVNALLFAAVVALTWLLAAELFPRSAMFRVVAAGAVALHPKLAALAGNVSTDVLLALAWTVFALVAVRMVRRGPTLGRAVALAAATAASVLTHGRGLALVLAALVAAVVILERHRPGRAAVLKMVAAGAVIVGVAVTLAAVWSANGAGPGGGGAFGGEITQSTGGPNPRGFLSYVFQFYFRDWSFLAGDIGPDYGWRQMYIETFFAGFANLEVVFTEATFDKLQLAVAFGLVLLWTQLIWSRDRLRRHWPSLVVLAGLVLSLLLVLHLSAYRDMLQNPDDPLITGRYLTPAIAIFGLAVAFSCVILPRRLVPAAAAAVLCTGVVLQVSALGVALTRFHA